MEQNSSVSQRVEGLDDKALGNILVSWKLSGNQHLPSFLELFCDLARIHTACKVITILPCSSSPIKSWVPRREEGKFKMYISSLPWPLSSLPPQSVVRGPEASASLCWINRISGPSPDLLNQNLWFNEIPGVFLLCVSECSRIFFCFPCW